MPDREELKRLIREAGWTGIYSQWTSPTDRQSITVPVEWDQIERFAALVAESCAKECEKTLSDGFFPALNAGIVGMATNACASAIRSRFGVRA